jgi:chemotaxis protein CheD
MQREQEGTVAAGAFHAGAIGMGEIGVAKGAGSLRTFVGSCFGLALYDRRQKVAGLAHIVLPDSKGNGAPPGKYADTAVPELVRLLRDLNGGGPLRLAAKLVGGAKMFAFQAGMTIGDQNVAAVEGILGRLGIPILGRCCGGDRGRRVSIDIGTGEVQIETIGSPVAVI